MSTSIFTYQIKAGDTLQSIAKELEIPAEVLRRYHNTNCDFQNLIQYGLSGVHEIFIPPADKIAELIEAQKDVALKNQLPSIYLTQSFYAPAYEVTERFEQQDKDDIEISYLASIQLHKIINKGFVAEIKTSGFKKNGESSDDKISMLSQACMGSISPVSFIVPVQGKINGFYDHKLIAQKFEDKRPDLESFFIGEVAEAYFNKFHESLKNEDYLLKQFCSTLLYQVLFPEMDRFHRKKEWEENFYVIPNSFPVKCRFHTEYNFENPDVVEIIIKGKIEEDCGLQELLKAVKLEELPEEKITCEIELNYTTHKETKQLRKIEANITLFHLEEVYREHHLTLLAKEEEKPVRKFSTLVEE